MLYLCPDAHGVLLVDQEVSTPKPVVRNAPCQAREVLDTVCWGPLYVEFVIKYHAQYASMSYYMDGIDMYQLALTCTRHRRGSVAAGRCTSW